MQSKCYRSRVNVIVIVVRAVLWSHLGLALRGGGRIQFNGNGGLHLFCVFVALIGSKRVGLSFDLHLLAENLSVCSIREGI